MSNLYEEQLKKDAQKRVDFRRHLSIYLAVITLLWVIWAFSGNDYIWPIWPTCGWGIAIIFHYVGAFDLFHFFSVKKEVEKLRHERR